MILIVYLLVFGLVIGLFLIHKRNNLPGLGKIPVIKGLISVPIFGTSLHILINRKRWVELLKNYEIDATPVRMTLINPIVMATRPEDIQIVLTSPKTLGKSYLYELFKIYLGEGLITAPVQKWKKNRKIVQVTFSPVILNQFVEIFSQKSVLFNETMAKTKGETFDMYYSFFKYSVDVIFETTLDVKLDVDPRTTQFGKDILRGRDILMDRVSNIFQYFDVIFRFTSMYHEEKEILQNFNSLVEDNLKKKKDKFLQELKNKDIKELEGNKILIDKLLELQNFTEKITDLELVDEIKTFVIAGSETTATTGCLAFILMAMYPEVQEKVYAEAMEVLGSKQFVDYTDIDKFVYLDKVIRETMRLFPIAGIILRTVDDDLKLSTCTIPKGCDVLLSLYALMRSEKYYPDPLKFDPERFNPEEIKKRPPYTYLPFSAGPRNCIGRHFAMMSMKTLISFCIREYRFETDYKRVEDIEVDITLLIKVQKGFPLRAIRRT